MRKLIFLLLSVLTIEIIVQPEIQAQSVQDTTIMAYGSFAEPAKVWKPDNMYSAGATHPFIFVMPGSGESSGATSNMYLYGPFKKIVTDGWVPTFTIDGVTVKPIFFTIQMNAFPTNTTTKDVVDRVIGHYLPVIDTNRIYMMGWSQGGQQTNYMMDNNAWRKDMTAVVNYQGVSVGSSGASYMARQFVGIGGGKWWGIEGASDPRDLDMMRDSINAVVPGEGRYTSITSGDGTTHTGLGFNRISDSTYKPNGDGLNIYTWMLRQTQASAPPAPPPTIYKKRYYILRKPD